MRAEAVIAALLNVVAITSIVGTRLARLRLPQGSAYPAVVYELVSSTPQLPITAVAGANVSRSRVQVTCIARTFAELDTLCEAVRVACSFKSGSLGGSQVVSVLPDGIQPLDRDDDVKVFIQSQDFIVIHFEA